MLFGICLISEINARETVRLTHSAVSVVLTKPPEETQNNASELDKQYNCMTVPENVSPRESNFKTSTEILNEMPHVTENVRSKVENRNKFGTDKTVNIVDNLKKNKEDTDVTSKNKVVYNLTKVENADPRTESYSKPDIDIVQKIADVIGKISEEIENKVFLIDEALNNCTDDSEVTSIYDEITQWFDWLPFA